MTLRWVSSLIACLAALRRNVVPVGFCLVAAPLPLGCASKQPWGDTPVESVALEPTTAEPTVDGWSAGLTAVGAVHPAVPHGSVELPAVSPDAKWIAYFRHAARTPRPTPESLVSGRGLQGVSLWVRDLKGEQPPRPAALEGACWPTWSADGTALFFVTYDTQRRAYLGRFDASTGQIERKGIGVGHLMMPAVSPDGTRVAVVGFNQVPERSELFVVEWSTASVTRVPVAAPHRPSDTADFVPMTPQWVNHDTLVFGAAPPSDENGIESWVGRVTVEPATLGASSDVANVTFVRELSSAGSWRQLVPWQAGLLRPFDAGHGGWLRRGGSGVALVYGLTEPWVWPLVDGPAAVAWWAPPWVVAGNQDALELVAIDPTLPEGADLAANTTKLRLLDGRWAPRCVDPDAGTLVAVGMGDDPERLAVYQLWFVVAE